MTIEEAKTLKIGDEVTICWDESFYKNKIQYDPDKVYKITRAIPDRIVVFPNVQYTHENTFYNDSGNVGYSLLKFYIPNVEDTEIIL